LFHVATPETPAQDILSGERHLLRDFTARVIRTGPPDIVTNCHGWLFAGGQFWIHGTEVNGILEDNGNGVTLHSALVRAATDDGLVLLEGKWGIYGRFIHGPADQHYAQQWTYYHSNRNGGNRLQGLGGETPLTPQEETVPAN
jgi:hypothetical protein